MFSGPCSVGGAHYVQWAMFSGRGTLLTGLTLMTWSAKTTIPITKWAVPTGCNKTEKLTLLL